MIFGEVLRWFAHRGKEAKIYFWRTKDGEEVDFIVETSAGIFPVEVKLGLPKASDIPAHDKLGIQSLREGAVVSLAAAQSAGQLLAHNWRYQDLSLDWFKN